MWWNKAEVTITLYSVPESLAEKAFQLNNINGALPQGWALHHLEPEGRNTDLVFRVEGEILADHGRHVHRALERMGLR